MNTDTETELENLENIPWWALRPFNTQMSHPFLLTIIPTVNKYTKYC